MSKGLAREIEMCGKTIRLGDHMKVEYSDHTGRIEGKVTEIWTTETGSHLSQVRLSNGWCFHEGDQVVEHRQGLPTPTAPGEEKER